MIGADMSEQFPGRHRLLAKAADHQRHRLQVVREHAAQQVRLSQRRLLHRRRPWRAAPLNNNDRSLVHRDRDEGGAGSSSSGGGVGGAAVLKISRTVLLNIDLMPLEVIKREGKNLKNRYWNRFWN